VTNVNLRAAARNYALPILILVFPLTLVWVMRAEDLYFLLVLFGIIPALAFLIGFLVRPAHVWIMPAAVVIWFWSAVAVDGRAAEIAPGNVIASVVFYGGPWLAAIWIGKVLGGHVGNVRWRREHGH
jgi:hypothetical protein